jgi:hypothetical protein
MGPARLLTALQPHQQPQLYTPNDRARANVPTVHDVQQAQASPAVNGGDSQVVPVFDGHRYPPDVVDLNFPVPANNAGSTKIVDAPQGYRELLGFRNTDAASNVLISFGKQATSNSFLSLAPGQMVLFDDSVPQGDIFVLSSTNVAATVTVFYSNRNRR